MWYLFILIGLVAGWLYTSTPSATIQHYVNIFDTFFYGPMKMYLGYQIYVNKWLPVFFSALLMIGGATTTAHSLKEIIEKKKKLL